MNQIEIDYYDTPILVSDAVNMLVQKINKNERPYVSKTIELNNKELGEWKTKVLEKIADSKGYIKSGRVWDSWLLYKEGNEIKKYNELVEDGKIVECPEDVVKYWKNFFENSTIEEMHSLGTGAVSYGWGLIDRHVKNYFAKRKWNELFSKSSDPLWWEQNYDECYSIIFGKEHPLWEKETYEDIVQKVSSILMNVPDPKKNSAHF